MSASTLYLWQRRAASVFLWFALVHAIPGHAAPSAPHSSGIITLSFAGDCTFGTVNGDDSAIRFPQVYQGSGRLDYPFARVRPWFADDDLTVVNFECTLTNATQEADKQWHFKGPARYAAIFPAGSVEVVGLANNHSFDYLQAGFEDTVANFKRGHVGVFYQNTPYVTTLRVCIERVGLLRQ